MKYYDLVSLLERGEIEDLQKLMTGMRNDMLEQFQDYYDGHQWSFSTGEKTTQRSNTTRSGKVMWEEKDKRRASPGFSRGELKVWNICDATVDIYTSYCRGNIADHNRVAIEGYEAIAMDVNDVLGDFDRVVTRSCHRMCVESVAVWKYREDGGIDFIPANEVYPIYHGNDRVGTVRIYVISRNDPILEGVEIEDAERYYYIEIWMPAELDSTEYLLYKFVNEVDVSDGKNTAPYPFDPYMYIPNKDHEFRNFDENNIEISDVDKLMDIQDDINAFVTDLGIINRKVALPMYRIAEDVFMKMMSGEISGEAVRRELEKLTLYAGRIMSAPIEIEESSGIPSSSMQYLDEMYSQLYRVSGVPKAIYISEGMGNISTKTVEHLMESLKRRVDEKRTNIENGVKYYVERHVHFQSGFVDVDEIVDATSVTWADIFSITKDERAEILLKAGQSDQLPEQYVLEKLLTIFGDQERIPEVMGMEMENNNTFKVDVEKALINRDLEQQKKTDDVEKVRKEASADKKKRDSVGGEIAKLAGQL